MPWCRCTKKQIIADESLSLKDICYKWNSKFGTYLVHIFLKTSQNIYLNTSMPKYLLQFSCLPGNMAIRLVKYQLNKYRK